MNVPDAPACYIIDTSSLIKWWDEDYSPQVFASLPERMASLIAAGRLRSVREVKDEIKDSADPKEMTLAKWCKAQADFFIDDDEDVLAAVAELMAEFQDPKRKFGISNADPFVIARALLSGPHWFVVSDENPANGNAHKNPNIPFVCRQKNVQHLRFFDFLRKEGWQL